MAINGASDSGSLITVPLHINGQDVTTEHTYDVINPGTGKVIWRAASASKRDAINAVETAQAAFPAWSRTKPAQRRDILLKAADILSSRGDELAQYMIEETGSGAPFALGFNIPITVEMLKDVAGRISGICGTAPVCQDDNTSAIVYKVPYGVILGIAPWNGPYILGFRACIYALAAGNTAILKGSELSPRCFWAIGQVFKDAGLPDGCLNVITHRPQDAAETTTALIEHPAIKKINFTGSTAVGSIIASTAGKNLKPVLMELGGKASAIVLDDADLKKAAHHCALGAFIHSGQACMATERILVHSSVRLQFVEELKKAIDALFNSGPVPILVNKASAAKNRKLVSDAVSGGAKLLSGDVDAQEETETRLRPIVVEGIKKDMNLYYQESFGPSVSLFTVESEEEAVQLANDTDYGLTSAIFTKDLQRGFRVAKQIESGAVHINNMTIHDEANLPHGGVKKSGWGRFNNSAGLEEFLYTKTVTWTTD